MSASDLTRLKLYYLDSTNNSRVGWGFIGSKNINDNVIYYPNRILRSGSTIGLVEDTAGVITNVDGFPTPLVLSLDGTYIMGLDCSATDSHINLDSFDPRVMDSAQEVVYTNLQGQETTQNPFTESEQGDIVEPVHVAAIGEDSRGINEFMNQGFVYNQYPYQRTFYTQFYNKLWRALSGLHVGSMRIAHEEDTTTYEVVQEGSNTEVSEYTPYVRQVLESAKESLDFTDESFDGSVTASQISELIDELLEYDTISNEFLNTLSSLLNTSAHLVPVQEIQGSVVTLPTLPFNSTFVDIASTATGLACVNEKTHQWGAMDFPSSDQTFAELTKNSTDWVSKYPYTYHTATDAYETSSNTVSLTTGASVATSVEAFWSNGEPTSSSYFIANNLSNAGSTFRFLGLTSVTEDDAEADAENDANMYAANQGVNQTLLTGFNKILVSDLWEDPNQYQTVAVDEDVQGEMKVSATSALATSLPCMMGAVNSAVFYVPLPTDINQENYQYIDTHWVLTTYTPNSSLNPSGRGLINAGQVLYKFDPIDELLDNTMVEVSEFMRAPSSVTSVIIPQIDSNTAHNENKLSWLMRRSQADIGLHGQAVGNVDPTDRNALTQAMARPHVATFTVNSAEYTCATPIANLDYGMEIRSDRDYTFNIEAKLHIEGLVNAWRQFTDNSPSLLMIGHFRRGICENYYNGTDVFAPIMIQPIGNSQSTEYRIHGTQLLDSSVQMLTSSIVTTGDTTFQNALTEATGVIDIDAPTTLVPANTLLEFQSALVRVYAVMVVDEVRDDVEYQFINQPIQLSATDASLLSTTDTSMLKLIITAH